MVINAFSASAGPTQVLEPSDESSLWSSPYGEVTGQWITFDLGTECPVGVLRLLAMSNTTCPKLASALHYLFNVFRCLFLLPSLARLPLTLLLL